MFNNKKTALISGTVGIILFLAAISSFNEEATQRFLRALSITSSFDLNDFILNVAPFEAFVPDKKYFKDSPMEFITFDEIFPSNNLSVIADVKANNAPFFDVFDIVSNSGFFTIGPDCCSTFPDILAWYQTLTTQERQRYLLQPSPDLEADFSLLSSPGLKVGEYNTVTLNNVTFTQSIQIIRGYFFPSCASRVLTFGTVVGNRNWFFKAGDTIVEVTDIFGNKFIRVGVRNAVTSFPFPEYNISSYTLDEDLRVGKCLNSKEIPKNEDGDEQIACKQLQISDTGGNVYLLQEVAANKNPKFTPVFRNLQGGGCGAFNLTDPLGF